MQWALTYEERGWDRVIVRKNVCKTAGQVQKLPEIQVDGCKGFWEESPQSSKAEESSETLSDMLSLALPKAQAVRHFRIQKISKVSIFKSVDEV